MAERFTISTRLYRTTADRDAYRRLRLTDTERAAYRAAQAAMPDSWATREDAERAHSTMPAELRQVTAVYAFVALHDPIKG